MADNFVVKHQCPG